MTTRKEDSVYGFKILIQDTKAVSLCEVYSTKFSVHIKDAKEKHSVST